MESPAVAAKSKNTDGIERIRVEDFDAMTLLLEQQKDSVEAKNRAEIAVASVAVEFNAFNRRMVKKYNLGFKGVVREDGTIDRNPPPPAATQQG
jgi:hypothetical protein